jgi:hypothetical protein
MAQMPGLTLALVGAANLAAVGALAGEARNVRAAAALGVVGPGGFACVTSAGAGEVGVVALASVVAVAGGGGVDPTPIFYSRKLAATATKLECRQGIRRHCTIVPFFGASSITPTWQHAGT